MIHYIHLASRCHFSITNLVFVSASDLPSSVTKLPSQNYAKLQHVLNSNNLYANILHIKHYCLLLNNITSLFNINLNKYDKLSLAFSGIHLGLDDTTVFNKKYCQVYTMM